jgi:hypothetical protein
MTIGESVRHNAAGISSPSESGGLEAAGRALQNKTPRTQSSHGTLRRSVLPRKPFSHTLRSGPHLSNDLS